LRRGWRGRSRIGGRSRRRLGGRKIPVSPIAGKV